MSVTKDALARCALTPLFISHLCCYLLLLLLALAVCVPATCKHSCRLTSILSHSKETLSFMFVSRTEHLSNVVGRNG